MLQEEIAFLRLKIDRLNNEKQEMEKKSFEDTGIVQEKKDHLRRTKLNEETLTKTVLGYNRQRNVRTAWNTMLNSQLENERQSKERRKSEAESYHFLLSAAASHHYEQSQLLIRHLDIPFQGTRDDCFHLLDKMVFATSNLKEINEILSQPLSNAESKFGGPEIELELHHARDAAPERTLVSEHVLKDLSQMRRQKEEIEHMFQRELAKMDTSIRKLESLETRYSHLQNENNLLRQQLHGACKKSDNNENRGINIQEQCHELIEVLRAHREKQSILVKERNKEILDELKPLKERIYKYENVEAEREVSTQKDSFQIS